MENACKQNARLRLGCVNGKERKKIDEVAQAEIEVEAEADQTRIRRKQNKMLNEHDYFHLKK